MLVKFTLSAAVVGLLALSWQAQRETNRRLDALVAAVAARPEAPGAHAPGSPSPAEPARLPDNVIPAAGAIPRELDHVTMPPYLVEAPDVLLVEVTVRDEAGGVKPLPTQPVSGSFLVRPDGTIGLGVWGSVKVAGLNLAETALAVRNQIAGPDRPVRAAALTAADLAVSIDVQAYNSKRYYVVTDTADGEQVVTFPCTGSDTVLDAMAKTGRFVAADKRQVWVARPGPGGDGWHRLPVDWVGITQQGMTQTNYQLLPGDRVYVKAGK